MLQRVSVAQAESMLRDNIDDMRKEYTRMRDIAQKRIGRMRESEFRNTAVYREHQQGFSKLKDLDKLTLSDFAKAFSELSKFVTAKGSTITGQKQIREKTIKTWQKQGLNLNQKNYDKVIKILEEMRRQKIVYGSDKAVELADSMLGLDDQQTNKWLDHLDTLLQHTEELQEIPDLQGYDFDEILDMLGE